MPTRDKNHGFFSRKYRYTQNLWVDHSRQTYFLNYQGKLNEINLVRRTGRW